LTDSDKVRDRWKEYIEDLYDKNNKPQVEDVHLATDTEDDVKGPPILFSEFEAALSELKKWKGRSERWNTGRTVKSTRC